MSQTPEEQKVKFPGPVVGATPTAPAASPYNEEPLTQEEKQKLNQLELSGDKPTAPLTARMKEACRLRAQGMTTPAIAEKLEYNKQYLYNAFLTPRCRAEMARYQDRMFEADVMTRLKALGPNAVDVIEELLNDPAVSALKKADKAQWVLEKLTGKAKQEHSVESNTLAAFTEVLRQMQQRGEDLSDIDVTPNSSPDATPERPAKAIAAVSSESKFSKWVEEEIE